MPAFKEEFKGYENPEQLANIKHWRYLLPRITGQGTVIPVNKENYNNIDEIEPCEFAVKKYEKDCRKAARKAYKDKLAEERKAEIAEKKAAMKKRKFNDWLEKYKEDNAAVDD